MKPALQGCAETDGPAHILSRQSSVVCYGGKIGLGEVLRAVAAART